MCWTWASLVGLAGFEPATSGLSDRCSTPELQTCAGWLTTALVVRLAGFEPATLRLKAESSTGLSYGRLFMRRWKLLVTVMPSLSGVACVPGFRMVWGFFFVGTGGGSRTHTSQGHWFLRPARLPITPPPAFGAEKCWNWLKTGGPGRRRSCDLPLMRRGLSQLSYGSFDRSRTGGFMDLGVWSYPRRCVTDFLRHVRVPVVFAGGDAGEPPPGSATGRNQTSLQAFPDLWCLASGVGSGIPRRWVLRLR